MTQKQRKQVQDFILGVILVVLLSWVLVLVCTDDSRGSIGGTSLRIYDVFETADSVILQHFVDGTADSTIWTDTNQVDTTIAAASLDTGLHIFYVQVKIDSGTEWLTSEHFVCNNTAGGDIDTVPVDVGFMEADSAQLIVSLNTSADTALFGACSSIDSLLTGILDSFYTINVKTQYDGDWGGAISMSIDNRTEADTVYSAPPSTVDNVCNVWGMVTLGGNDAVQYATVIFTPPAKQHNSCDTSLMFVEPVKRRTNADGYFMAPLVYSSCLGSKPWTMLIQYPDLSDISKPVTVPDSASYRVKGW